MENISNEELVKEGINDYSYGESNISNKEIIDLFCYLNYKKVSKQLIEKGIKIRQFLGDELTAS